jgi:YHS domain-containing protein
MYRLFLIFGLLVVLFLLLRSVYRNSKPGGRPAGPTLDGDQMVQDPVCGVFVPRKTAIVQQVGNLTNCFCSQECAEKFQQQ